MLKKYFIIGICLTTYGCFTPSMDMKAKVSNKANYDSAIPIDFIFIFNDKAFDEIKKLSAYDWFLKKEQYYNDYAITDEIQILSYEFVPGQSFELHKFKPNRTPSSLIIFANYLISGDHRVVLKEYSKINIDFNENSFAVSLSK